ncbi:MAG: ribonuclease HI [Eubacteriales bacterium]|nr:ribonuclease HI [Eubacteriales bacterium]MDY3332337.1 ribonuclease H [Gallibacter sp.]
MTTLEIHTDGGCRNNQLDENIGGWGAVLKFGEHEKLLKGGTVNTTNNRMELTALLKAMSALKKDKQDIEIYSDSSYLMECFRKKWYVNWEKNGWKTASKKQVENQDLWKPLIDLIKRHNVTFYRVKGHTNLNHPNTNTDKLFEKYQEWNGTDKSYEHFENAVIQNNLADMLANEAMDSIEINQIM